MSDQIEKLFKYDCFIMDQDYLNITYNLHSSNTQIISHESQNKNKNRQNQICSIQAKNSFTNIQILQHSQLQAQCLTNQKNYFKRNIKASAWHKTMGLMRQSPCLQKQKYIKKKKFTNQQIESTQYPTKNFLQNFRGAHLSYLEFNNSQKQLNKCKVYRSLKFKNCINMEDYKDLYNVPEFEATFDKMFKTKYLYRHLMKSRSGLDAKLNHHKKIEAFQSAFKTKTFHRIN